LRQRQGSGGQVGWLFPALAGHTAGVIAPVHTRSAIDTVTPIHRNGEGRLATLGPAAAIDARAPIHQGAALGRSAPLATGVRHGG
jgi:hypothetical protein